MEAIPLGGISLFMVGLRPKVYKVALALKDSEALKHSRRAGERLLKTIKLRQEVETKIKELKM